jgi:hypothetical protein
VSECESVKEGYKPVRRGFEEKLLADIVFHNPAALELMLGAYGVPPHLSFTASPSSSSSASASSSAGKQCRSDGISSSTNEVKEAKEEVEKEEEADDWDYLWLQERRHRYMSEEFLEKVSECDASPSMSLCLCFSLLVDRPFNSPGGGSILRA